MSILQAITRHSLTFLAFALAIGVSLPASAQRNKKKKVVKELTIYEIDTLQNPVPMQRSLFFSKIDEQLKKADLFDGNMDSTIYFGEDSAGTRILTQAILYDVRQIRIMIENLPIADKFTENQTKLGYHRALTTMLIHFNNDARVDPKFYKKLVANFRDLVIAKQENRIHEFVVANANIYTFTNSQLLDDADKDYVCTEIGKEDPVMMLKRLGEFANKPCADVVIARAAKIVPKEIYNYATSTIPAYNNAVSRNADPLVQAIARIARESKSPLKAMAFLSDIYNKKLTIAEVDHITSNHDLFYKNLVRLKLENNDLAENTYTNELQYRGLKYVREMNDLHESPDNVRFKCIDSMNAEALYFIMVYGQDEIYTSSFLGTFRRFVSKLDSNGGFALLQKVHYDKFRTFIRMCAGYNTLPQFLSTMNEENKVSLLKDFIANLEKGKDDDLEDAVDVADAFGSIDDQALMTFLREEVRNNYERSYKDRSMKGLKVYALLATLSDGSADSVSEEVIRERSEKLRLPPINFVPYSTLTTDTNAVVQQFFFYGDEDGKNSYASFLTNFKETNRKEPAKWKITNSKYWTVIQSTSGKPVTIYANLPLPEPEDEEAQKQLNKYLDANDIHPAIIVHRGHSYHLPVTLERLSKHTKIVVLGSCGGYHNLSTVLNNSPDAQIISTKQTGAMSVNEPIIRAINTKLLAGADINWITMWKDLSAEFRGKKNELTFKEYVPPYKNLGAIFIKAYRRLEMLENEAE